MPVSLIRGDARHLPLADNSVDLVVTSPPFLNLRSYSDGGTHYDGQIGVGTRERFLQDLWDVTAEMARVLKPTGSIWVELGDSYTNKSLNMSPHRYAIGCVDKLGLILRAEVIWSRPNGLPESVTDRVRRSHSVWFHFVRQPRYYSAIDTIREAHSGRLTPNIQPLSSRTGPRHVPGNTPRKTPGPDGMGSNPLGKLPGSVWTVATQPLRVPPELGISHFAAFPVEWPRRIILGWSPSGICTACGEGRRPVADRERHILTGSFGQYANAHGADGRTGRRAATTATITGEVCGCPDTTAPTRPSVVVDPFGGTGTTALVADVLGRHGITVDMSADYCRLAAWRTTDPKQRERAGATPGKPRPKPAPAAGRVTASGSDATLF